MPRGGVRPLHGGSGPGSRSSGSVGSRSSGAASLMNKMFGEVTLTEVVDKARRDAATAHAAFVSGPGNPYATLKDASMGSCDDSKWAPAVLDGVVAQVKAANADVGAEAGAPNTLDPPNCLIACQCQCTSW